MKTFIIARYYFNSLFREVAHEKFIDDLSKEPFIDEAFFTYALGDFKTIEERGYTFIQGTFGKIKKTENSKTYDKEEHKFQEGYLSDKVVASIQFILHHDSHLIFIEQSSKIDYITFVNKFSDIYEHNTENPAAFQIDFLSDEKSIYEIINSWDSVIRATFKNLRPSNPSSDDSFANIEKLIKETKSERTNLSFKVAQKKEVTEDDGLDFESTLLREALSLSAHGYGEAIVDGFKGEKMVHVDTKRKTKKIEITFDDEGAIESIIKKVEEIQKYETKR